MIMKGSRNGSLVHLQKENEKATRERDDIQAEFETFKRELKHTDRANTTKELRVLKKVVQNLESDSMKEKTKHQRIINKKNKEYRNLVEELEELRASERNLRARCRSLTNELAVFKRSSRISPAPSNTSGPRRSSSRGSIPRDRRSTSQDRRSASRERRPVSRDRIASTGGARRKRTPSPAAPPRFDPTAYIKDKQRKTRESQNQRGRKRTLSSGSLPRGRSRSLSSDRLAARQPSASRDSASKIALPRTSSTGSMGSRRSSQSSIEGAGILTDQSNGRLRRRKSRNSKSGVTKRGKENSRPSEWTSPDASDTGSYTDLGQARALYSSTPEHGRTHSRTKPGAQRYKQRINSEIEDSFNRSAEMMEIDARLNALQHFMKANLQ